MKNKIKYLVLICLIFLSPVAYASGDGVVEVSESVLVDELDIGNSSEYFSDDFLFDIPVWMVGVNIDSGEMLYDLEMEIRGDVNGEWSDWIGIHMEDANLIDGKMFIDPVALDSLTNKIQYKLSGDIQDISKVELVGLDPFDYENESSTIQGIYQKGGDLDVINRDEWGADESIMFWDDDMDHATVKQIVVHHTAGNDNSPLDPAAVVRGIYHYHTVTKGWGDIGYNFLIDQYGNVYEGRKGGVGAVAAHAYGFNTGSVGISVLGNYENTTPSDNSILGLENTLAYVAFQTGIDLDGVVHYNDRTVEVVSGHKDVGQTACPGAAFYGILPQIREDAKDLSIGMGVKQFEARLMDLSTNKVFLNDGEVVTIEAEYLNTGTGGWLNGYREVRLVTMAPNLRSSEFADSNWQSSSVVGEAFRYSVMPNDYGLFKLNLRGNNDEGIFTESFALMANGKMLTNTQFTVVIENSGHEAPEYEYNFHGIHQKYYQYEVVEHPVLNIIEGEKIVVQMELKNTGDNNWDKDGLFPIHLATKNPTDHYSIFYNSNDWMSTNRLEMMQDQVLSGQTAMFQFEVGGNLETGRHEENYGLVLENISWIDGEELRLMINVEEPRYSADLVEMSDQVPYMIPGQVSTLWLDVQNTGNQTWYKDGSYPLYLGTSHSKDRSSDFYNPDYWITSNRATELKIDEVDPGEIVRLEFLVQAPERTGTYLECFVPLIEDKTWLNDAGACWDIIVQ